MSQLVSTLVLDGVDDASDLLKRFARFGSREHPQALEVFLDLYDAKAVVRTEGGRFTAVARANESGALATMKSMIAFTVEEAVAGTGTQIVWTGHGAGSRTLPQFREMRVVDAWNVTPRMRRVRLAGEDLGRYATGGIHVRLLIPPAGRAPVWPHAGPSAVPVWPEGEDGLVSRVYTIRRIDAASGVLDLDVVLHEGSSPGGDWARQARSGDIVGILGPGGGGTNLPRRVVLFGDETALPAIARILEDLPEDAEGEALVEVHDERERQTLRHPSGVSVRWLFREGRMPGTTGLLAEAAAALDPELCRECFFWSGTEFTDFRLLRSRCRRGWGLCRSQHAVTAYWRRETELRS